MSAQLSRGPKTTLLIINFQACVVAFQCGTAPSAALQDVHTLNKTELHASQSRGAFWLFAYRWLTKEPATCTSDTCVAWSCVTLGACTQSGADDVAHRTHCLCWIVASLSLREVFHRMPGTCTCNIMSCMVLGLCTLMCGRPPNIRICGIGSCDPQFW